MEPFEIFIAHISWGSDGKNRPVLVMEHDGNIYRVFSITTQYQNKSAAIQANYLPIIDLKQAGLNKQSYIDANKKIDLPDTVVSGKPPIGSLSEADKQRLLELLES